MAKLRLLDGTAEEYPYTVIHLEERACSDCEEYARESEMTRTPAGNMVCGRCARRRDRLERERQQLTMFGQKGLFQ